MNILRRLDELDINLGESDPGPETVRGNQLPSIAESSDFFVNLDVSLDDLLAPLAG